MYLIFVKPQKQSVYTLNLALIDLTFGGTFKGPDM